MQDSIIIVQTTFPSEQVAAKVAKTLITEKLAACAQVGSAVKSYYRWEGELYTEEEWPVTFKLSEKYHQEFREKLLELHPYDVPQYYHYAVTASVGYDEWVNS